MKRGRPSFHGFFREQIVTALRTVEHPVTVKALMRSIERRSGRRSGWHTVFKYLQQLADQRIIDRHVLPVEKGRKPLVLYSLRNG